MAEKRLIRVMNAWIISQLFTLTILSICLLTKLSAESLLTDLIKTNIEVTQPVLLPQQYETGLTIAHAYETIM